MHVCFSNKSNRFVQQKERRSNQSLFFTYFVMKYCLKLQKTTQIRFSSKHFINISIIFPAFFVISPLFPQN